MKTPRICLALAVAILVYLLILRASVYVEGKSFTKSWLGPLSVFPALACFLACFVTAIVTTIEVLRKKVRPRWLLAILAVAAGWVGAYQIPFPEYTDGMRDRLRAQVPLERLRLFAEAAKAEAQKPLPPPPPDQLPPDALEAGSRRLAELMQRDFPEIHALSPLPPRVGAGAQGVHIYWGSALVKHWGITLGQPPFADSPADYRSKLSIREVYAGVWVYHDIY